MHRIHRFLQGPGTVEFEEGLAKKLEWGGEDLYVKQSRSVNKFLSMLLVFVLSMHFTIKA